MASLNGRTVMHLRALNPQASHEIDLVAQRMRATLIEVEGESVGSALYSMDWLRDRVMFHLDPQRSEGQVLLVVEPEDKVLGHTIVRREAGPDGRAFGLFSTTYVVPDARRRGVAEALLQAGEQWMRSRSLTHAATWTSATNIGLIRLYSKHGYRQTALHPHDTTGTSMVKLERTWSHESRP